MRINGPRAQCSEANPMTPERVASEGPLWQHERVVAVGEQRDGWPAGDTQDYMCLDCGTRWTEELPQ